MNMYEDVVKRDMVRLFYKYKDIIEILEDSGVVGLDLKIDRDRKDKKWLYSVEYKF